ncbi:MAG TPA: DUF1043 family protein [Dongiaceae bacterium]|nr:DUF1043 family protein [Dongiaceae bacterium]
MEITTILAFLVGCLAGGAVGYFALSRTRAESKIERQMRELQEEFTAYRENVNQHFNKTAQLVNSLTENYIAVQKHLEDAADSFAEAPKSFSLEESAKLPAAKNEFVSLESRQQQELRSSRRDAEFEQHSVEPPKDYAPKTKPGDKGTLAEDFGLKDTKVF